MIRGYEKVLKYSTLLNNSNLEFFVENEEKMPFGYNDVGDIGHLKSGTEEN